MTQARGGRRGAAFFTLLSILAITAAWWALALWPVGTVEPEWLARTRAACFGSMRGGLPDAGGWILLVGQPLGMVGVLFAVWGEALKEDLRRFLADRRWRRGRVLLAMLAVAGIASLGWRVARASALGASQRRAEPGTPTRIDVDASTIALVDQHGRRASLAEFRGRTVLLTFAFGHCATVCPMIVHDVRTVRAAVNRPEVPLVVMTLDPWRDTPERLPALAGQWGLAAEDRVLSGDVAEVEHALDALGIGRRRDDRTGDIAHSGTVMIVDQRGHVVWRLDGGWGRLGELLARQ